MAAHPAPDEVEDATSIAVLERLDELRPELGRTCLRAFGLSRGSVVLEHVWGDVGEDGEHWPVWALECGERAQLLRRGRWCPFCPSPHHTNQLAPIAGDLTDKNASTGYHAFICDNSRVLGHVVTETAPRVDREREVLVGLRRALIAWDERAPRGKELAHVLLTASGRRLSWSASARVLLGSNWDAISVSMRDRIDDPTLEPLVVGGHVAAWSLMKQGPQHAHLISFSRPEPLLLDWSHSLGTHQLDVANLATRGLDNPSIARTLGVSRNTVKYHLKRVYEHLQLSSRAELTALLGLDATGCVHAPHLR